MMEHTQTGDTIKQEEQEAVIYKKVPWISWDEWNFFKYSLFSSSPHTINTAVKRIAICKIRGSLPIVVDAAAAIIEFHLIDPKFRKDLKENDMILERRLASEYCMAILRLVNGVVYHDRNKRGKKDKRELSINEAANEIGLPCMLIDIRHEASHRDVPSLQLLHETSVKAAVVEKDEAMQAEINYHKLQFTQVRKECDTLQLDLSDA